MTKNEISKALQDDGFAVGYKRDFIDWLRDEIPTVSDDDFDTVLSFCAVLAEVHDYDETMIALAAHPMGGFTVKTMCEQPAGGLDVHTHKI